jgi:hypothetical protein
MYLILYIKPNNVYYVIHFFPGRVGIGRLTGQVSTIFCKNSVYFGTWYRNRGWQGTRRDGIRGYEAIPANFFYNRWVVLLLNRVKPVITVHLLSKTEQQCYY